MLGLRSQARFPAILLLLSLPAVCAADTKPLAQVGSATLSLEAFTRRLALMPDFQRAALADDAEKLKRQVLTTQLVPELLFAEEAERQKLSDRPAVRERIRELLRAAMEREIQAESARVSPVEAADIQAYFEANRARFETPRRIHIWRILTDDEALAKRIINECKGVDGVKRWTQFATEASLDKATHLRGGELGFVHPDGNTDTPTLRVDVALFAAADPLSDGQIAPQPIREGGHYAVIWRRGSMKAVNRSLAQEEGAIRQVLERQRGEQARGQLLEGLRRKYLSQSNDALLDTLRFDVEGVPEREPKDRAPHAAAASARAPDPKHGDR